MSNSDPKQQKQVLILLVLFVVFGVVLYIQFMTKKPAEAPAANTDNKPKSQNEHQIVAVSTPFVQPNGNERDPFVVPVIYDELPDVPKNTPSVNRLNRRTPNNGPGLMPLPGLPTSTQTMKQEPGTSTTNVTPVVPVVHNPPSFMLVGTVLGSKKMAIVRGPNGGDQIAVGDQAADGSLLVSVSRESATFIKDGKSYKMTVGED